MLRPPNVPTHTQQQQLSLSLSAPSHNAVSLAQDALLIETTAIIGSTKPEEDAPKWKADHRLMNECTNERMHLCRAWAGGRMEQRGSLGAPAVNRVYYTSYVYAYIWMADRQEEKFDVTPTSGGTAASSAAQPRMTSQSTQTTNRYIHTLGQRSRCPRRQLLRCGLLNYSSRWRGGSPLSLSSLLYSWAPVVEVTATGRPYHATYLPVDNTCHHACYR
eukprot:GHVU01026853.1.p1 GENE.GHVU01026853.1~~GHVU01026853.1.p1  ORF type:complete len:218 (-),score=15.52 GHVU01026853.1:483-1136(-)